MSTKLFMFSFLSWNITANFAFQSKLVYSLLFSSGKLMRSSSITKGLFLT